MGAFKIYHITLEQGFVSNEHVEYPERIVLSFSEQLIEKTIKPHLDYAEQHNVTVCLDFDRTDEMCPDYREDHGSHLKMYPNGKMYYYSQSKYDAATQFESVGFTVEDILTKSHVTATINDKRVKTL